VSCSRWSMKALLPRADRFESIRIVEEDVHSANAALHCVMRDPWNNDASNTGHELSSSSCKCRCETSQPPSQAAEFGTMFPELSRIQHAQHADAAEVPLRISSMAGSCPSHHLLACHSPRLAPCMEGSRASRLKGLCALPPQCLRCAPRCHSYWSQLRASSARVSSAAIRHHHQPLRSCQWCVHQ